MRVEGIETLPIGARIVPREPAENDAEPEAE
jgi:hypothetical protein